MTSNEEAVRLRKLSQRYAYTSIQLHEGIGRAIGLPGTDHKYLGFILQKGQMTAGELAAVTGLTTGAVTALIDRFERKKLVKRQPDKTDRRKVIILPNVDRITKLITPFYKDFQDETDAFFASFTKDELHVLERYFLRAMEMMNEKIKQI